MIDYSARAMVSFLQLCGIKFGPQQLDVDSEQHHYFYPPATRFPQNSLIRDTVDYFLQVKGNIKDRRVGFLIQSTDGRLMALVVNLTEPKSDETQQLKGALLNQSQEVKTDDVLKNTDQVTKFRALYAKAECVLLGLNPRAANDAAILNQISGLIQNAYAIKKIQLNFIPMAQQPSNAVLFNDLLSVFKRGVFSDEDIKTINHQMPELSEAERAAIVNPLKLKLAEIKQENTELYQQILEEAAKLHRHLEVVKWRFQQRPPINLLEYNKLKQRMYTSTFTEEQLLQALGIEMLLPLVIQQQAADVFQLLQTLDERVLSDLEAWEASVKTQLEKLHRKDIGSQFYAAAKLLSVMVYNSTLIPIGGVVVPTMVGEIEGPIKEHAQYGVRKVSKGLAYGLTMSDNLSERFAEGVVNTMKSNFAWQVVGSLVGLYCTYLLGMNTLMRSFAFVTLTSQIYRYGYTQHFDDVRASVTPAILKDVPLHTLGRVVGLLLGLVEVVYTRKMIQLLVCAGGFIGSLSAVKLTEDPRHRESNENKTITFISSLGGQQLGRGVIALAIFSYFALHARSERRALFLEYFRDQAGKNNIDEVNIQFSNWIFSIWNLMTGHDSVGISFSNTTSGLFYNGYCDIGSVGMACDPALPGLTNITAVPDFTL